MLPLARYRLDFRVATPLVLPPFAGSALRGVFGSALRYTACLTKAKVCDGCPLLNTCPYAQVFEPRPPRPDHPLQNFSQIPRPYVIEPPEWGETLYKPGDELSFNLVLAGRALEQLPIILWAFNKALENGVGRADGKALLERVVHLVGNDKTVILDGPTGSIADHITTPPSAPSFSGQTVTLHFDTPLRLQDQGHRASVEEHTPRRLLMALIRRIALMAEFHGDGPLALDFKGLATSADSLQSDRQLEWRDWTRYSSRQRQKMQLGGFVGRWTLRGDSETLSQFLPFLHLGQWLHVGKEAVFGLGGYRLEMVS